MTWDSNFIASVPKLPLGREIPWNVAKSHVPYQTRAESTTFYHDPEMESTMGILEVNDD